MNYEVVWDIDAERELARIWLASRLRFAIRDVADQMDAALSRAPHQCGESRDEGHRILLVSPLGVLFQVDDNERQVRVLSVWNY
jgi:hypothetical protein